MVEPAFAAELRRRPIRLALASLLLAKGIAYPALEVSAQLSRIDELAVSARSVIDSRQPLAAQAELLADYLFQTEGFAGNVADYGDPDNSYLNAVLDRRLGIPISLSVLYVAVALRLGIPARGVGLPGHFIVAAGHGERDLLFDPFHRGGRLSLIDCQRLVQLTTGYQGPFRPEWLRPLTSQAILIRMLNNLRHSYLAGEAWPEAQRVLEHLQAVEPDAVEHLRDLGLVFFRQGKMRLAAAFLQSYLEQVPDSPDADLIRQGLAGGLAKWGRAN
jgi:regulator of sirC expression with transglutaminase-like and TPR domain